MTRRKVSKAMVRFEARMTERMRAQSDYLRGVIHDLSKERRALWDQVADLKGEHPEEAVTHNESDNSADRWKIEWSKMAEAFHEACGKIRVLEMALETANQELETLREKGGPK